MPAPVTTKELVDLVRKSGLIEEDLLVAFISDNDLTDDAAKTARVLVKNGLLTRFQINHLLAGRYKGMVLGQYRLLDQIGQGGTGIVFLAEHSKMRKRVAIKVLPADRAKDREALHRFFREARAVAMLDHPNIVRGHDANRWGSMHYLVMEFVDGKSLQKHLDERGPIHHMLATRYAAQVASGLQHAFEKGLVHRDIKPANLLVDRQGVVKILDMGLARFFGDQEDLLTRDYCKGALLGTADFLSPEQAVRCHSVDIRADIYSLGATYYTLLIGKAPFAESKLAQKLVDHQMHMPVAPHLIKPEIPREITAIVFKMLAKKPQDRFQTPGELYEALDAVLTGKASTINEMNLQDAVDTIRIKVPKAVEEIFEQTQGSQSPQPPTPPQSLTSKVVKRMSAIMD